MSSLLATYGIISRKRTTPFLVPLTTNGLPTGNHDANVDGSVTPVDFFFNIPPGFLYVVATASAQLTGGGNPGFQDYGAVPGPLTNGLIFIAKIRGNTFEFDVNPIKSNQDWMSFAPMFQEINFAASITLRTYSFSVLDHSDGVIFDGDLGDMYGIRVRDDLSGMVAHQVAINGYYVKKAPFGF